MAKRKRLTPANPAFLIDPAPITEAAKRAPIADVASDASAMAALEEMTQRRKDDLENGRLVQDLLLDQIDMTYLVRDRVVVDDEDMQALMESIRSRGQQTPIEVVMLEDGRYGLISGWRRCEAIRQLHANGQGTGMVTALLRRPEGASDAYLAMVEENEIRVGLSYFERARIAMKAVEQGVFETEKQALLSLFSAASRAKRSKIRSFIDVVRALDDRAQYPHLIGERMGLALAKAVHVDLDLTAKLRTALTAAAPQTAEAEQALLQKLLAQSEKPTISEPKLKTKSPKPAVEALGPGLALKTYPGGNRLELSGDALTEDLRTRLIDWLRAQERS